MQHTESLTEWQLRIRNATTPAELLQVADEMKARSEEARRRWLAPADSEQKGRADRARGARFRRREADAV